MNATRTFLLLQALIFTVFGIFSFLNPESSRDLLGAPSMSAMGIYEMRGIYGGVSIGAALLFWAGFLKQDMQRPALFFLLAYMGGYVLARVAAIPLDGIPTGKMPYFVAFETVSGLVAAYLLKRKTT